MTSAFVEPAFRGTALLFPTGGAHWPGMGQDLDDPDLYASWIDRASLALTQEGAKAGALRGLMAGENQVRRISSDAGWQWIGDFPLSVAAQTVVGACLGDAFTRVCGAPGAVAGESMGECAAYCVAGALEIEQAVVVAYRWASSLQRASDHLGLRMVVVENLTEQQLVRIAEPFDAHIVVVESPTLFVLSIPIDQIATLQTEAVASGGTLLVSNNPCVAHDPRLGRCKDVWRHYEEFVRGLRINDAQHPLLSALSPGSALETPADLRDNLIATTTSRVHWSSLVGMLPHLGVSHLLQLGIPSRPYALEKLRDQDPRLHGARTQALRTVSGIRKLAERRLSQPPPGCCLQTIESAAPASHDNSSVRTGAIC